jgi:hypothetical protein
MNEQELKVKRVRTTAEAVGLAFFYLGMLAFLVYAILGLANSGVL